MSDELPIVRRLREIDTGDTPAWAVADAAAFVICELVAALEPFAALEIYCGDKETDPDDEHVKIAVRIGDLRRARAVLKEVGGGDA